jgi:hypothetical protein
VFLAASLKKITAGAPNQIDRNRRQGEPDASQGQENSMVREFQIVTVGLVFLFLGAIVAGVL